MLKWICKERFKLEYALICIFLLAILSISNTACDRKNSDGILQFQVLHVPPGNPNTQVVNVGSESELEAHLEHGDIVFGTDLDADGTGELTFRIDDTIKPIALYVSGFRGGPPRPLGVLEQAGGGRTEYITNEVMVQTDITEHLESFLAMYGGVVARDDTVLIGTEGGGTQEIPGGAEGLRVVSFDPSMSKLLDLPKNAMAVGLTGALAFSSIDALRALALQLREQTLKASLNTLSYPQSLNEHPDDDGTPIDFAQKW